MEDILRYLVSEVRWADLLDIAIVSVLIYGILIWLRQRASRTLGMVIIILASAFALANSLDLYLTKMAFHYGMIGILLAFAIVFQDDLRHGFERLANIRWLSRSSQMIPSQAFVEELTEAIVELAQERIGALIVLPGRQSLDRHVRGGVAVDAKVSKPLLMSIFHPKSLGHDGAILITQGRIAKLGVQLPLTRRVEELQASGMRHAAAMGLAECCDAMIVVVSEERGTITLALDHEFKAIDSVELAERLRRHLGDQPRREDQPRRARVINQLTQAVAIAAAVCLWWAFAVQVDTIQRTFVVPVEYRNLPPQWEIDSPKPNYIELTLSGSQPAFRLLDPTAVRVSLEITQVNEDRLISLPAETNLINVPAELSVEQIKPSNIIVSIRKKAEAKPTLPQ